ncbi:MAG: sulfite exporter TauE/SafE family protein [Microthrixaceae bacterium]
MTSWIPVAAIGAGIGFLGGLFGKGGSAVASPLLAVVGLPPIAAVATPLPSTIPSALAADRYRRAGLLDRRVILTSLLAGGPATVAGAVATRWIDPAALLVATELLLVGLGIRLIVGSRRQVEHDTVAPPRTRTLVGVGAAVGLAGGLLANSGGFLLAPLYLSVARLPIKSALGASLAVSAVLAIPGTVVHAALGHIDWPVAAVLAVCAVPASRLGASVAIRADPGRMERAFGAALVALGIFTLFV